MSNTLFQYYYTNHHTFTRYNTPLILFMAGIFRHNRSPTKAAHSSFFRWAYWRQYTVSDASYSRIAEDGPALDRVVIENVYKKRAQVGLWWWATVPTKVQQKATIRHHYARTLRSAFVAAMKERGLQRDGTMREGGSQKSLAAGIQGSLQLLGNPKLMEVTSAELRRECLSVVDQIIRFQGRGDEGKTQYIGVHKKKDRIAPKWQRNIVAG